MAERSRTPSLLIALLALLAVFAVSCGGDSDSPGDPGTSAEAESSGDGDGIAGTVDDDLLVVSRDYLQGVWCDSDGTTITVDGDIATLADSTGAGLELPLDVLLIDNVDNELVSQSDDEFVLSVAGDEVTFVRGAC